MPKTTLENLFFTALMVFCMVFCMTCYVLALSMGGLSYAVLRLALREMWVEYAVVFLLIFFCITGLAKCLAFRLFSPEMDRPIFIILAIQCFTVCLTVPAATLFATLVHNGPTADWLPQWLQLAATCFPAALCIQVFFVGPLVRWIFRTVSERLR